MKKCGGFCFFAFIFQEKSFLPAVRYAKIEKKIIMMEDGP